MALWAALISSFGLCAFLYAKTFIWPLALLPFYYHTLRVRLPEHGVKRRDDWLCAAKDQGGAQKKKVAPPAKKRLYQFFTL
jgi:hypothetical protein